MKKTVKKSLSVFLALVMMLSCAGAFGGLFRLPASAGGVTVSAHYQYYTPGYWNDESTLYLTNADGGTNAEFSVPSTAPGWEVNYLYSYGSYPDGGTIHYNNAYATKYVDYRTNKTIDSLEMYVHFDNSPVISLYPWTRVELRTEGCDWAINREANEHGVYTYAGTYYKLNGGSKNNLPSGGSVDLWVQSHNMVLGPSSEYIYNNIWWKGHQHYNTIYITFYIHDTTNLYNEVYAASTQTAVNNGSALYTADSWAAFINAYNNAAARITNTNDQTLINAAQSDLINARNALVRIYTVSFTDDANNVLSSQKLVAGTSPSVPAIPAKPSDVLYHYTVNGWDSEVTAAGADKTYKAVYTATAHSGMDDFTCDVCDYYDAAGALADAKTKAVSAITEAAGSAPSYGVTAVVRYALARINAALAIDAVNTDKENALAAIDALVNDKTAALAEAEAALANANAELAAAQTALVAAQTALTEKDGALTEKNAALTQMQSALNTANTALTDAQSQIEGLTASLTEKENALTAANAALTAERKEKAALETTLAAKETALAGLQDTVDADAVEIAALEADIEELEAAVTEKEGVIAAKTKEISDLEASVAAKETAIAAAQTKIDGLAAELTAAQTKVDTLTAALAEANSALAAKDAALTNANAELATANAALVTANAQISTLTEEVGSKTAALTTAENNLTTANSALAAAQTQIDGLTAAFDDAKKTLADKQTALTEVNAALTAALTEKSTLEAALAAKETALAGLKDTVDADAFEIAALESAVAGLEAAIAEKDAVITEKTGEIDTLKAGVAAYETAIAGAENEISVKQAEITSLQTRLNKALADIEALREGIYVEPEDDGTCKACGRVHQSVFDKFLCMLIRFFDFLISVFEFSSAT